MEGLALRQVLLCPSTTRFSSAALVSSNAVRIGKSGSLPSAGINRTRGVRLPYSPAVKVHAAKKQTFTSFDDMITNSELPVLVDFYATWCGPCQLMGPILNDVGVALKDKISVVKVDTEKYPNVASRYGIQALPTFVLFVNGKPVDVLEGAHPKDRLIENITEALKAQKVNVNQ